MLPTIIFPTLFAGLVPELPLASDARAGMAASPFGAVLQATMMTAPALTPAAPESALATLPGNAAASAPIAAETGRPPAVLPLAIGTVATSAAANAVTAVAGAPQHANAAPELPGGAVSRQPVAASPQPRGQNASPMRPDQAARQRLVPDALIPQPIGTVPTPIKQVGSPRDGVPAEVDEGGDDRPEKSVDLPVEAATLMQPTLAAPAVAPTPPVLPLGAAPKQPALPVAAASMRPVLPASPTPTPSVLPVATNPTQPVLPVAAQMSPPTLADRSTASLPSASSPGQAMPAQPVSPAPATQSVLPAPSATSAEADLPTSSVLPDASVAPIVVVVPGAAAPELAPQPALVGLNQLAAPTSNEITAPRGKNPREHVRPAPIATVVGLEANARQPETAPDAGAPPLPTMPQEGVLQEAAATIVTPQESPAPAELRLELPAFIPEQATPSAIWTAPAADARSGELPGFVPQLQATATFTAAEQVTARLFAHEAAEGGSRLTIELDPMELGSIEVSLQRDEHGTASVTFTVERPETLQLLQRDQRTLVDLLAGAGFSVDSGSLGFELRQEQQEARQQHQPAPHHHAQRGRADGEGRPGSGPAPPPLSRGLLDLRV